MWWLQSTDRCPIREFLSSQFDVFFVVSSSPKGKITLHSVWVTSFHTKHMKIRLLLYPETKDKKGGEGDYIPQGGGTGWWLTMTWLKKGKNFKKEQKKRKWGREKKSGLLFAPHFLLVFCFILSRMTSAAHPGSVSFHLPSAFSLHFKLALVFSSVCQISLMMELFVPLDVPSCTPHYSQSRTELLHLWVTNFNVFFQDAAE